MKKILSLFAFGVTLLDASLGMNMEQQLTDNATMRTLELINDENFCQITPAPAIKPGIPCDDRTVDVLNLLSIQYEVQEDRIVSPDSETLEYVDYILKNLPNCTDVEFLANAIRNKKFVVQATLLDGLPSWYDIDKSGSYYSFTYYEKKLTRDILCEDTNLISVVIPNTVTSIRRSAFKRCTNLINVAMPVSIVKIQREAFSEAGLKEITIPPKCIPDTSRYPFARCINLSKITFLGNVEYLERFCPNSFRSLESLTISIDSKHMEKGSIKAPIENLLKNCSKDVINACDHLKEITIIYPDGSRRTMPQEKIDEYRKLKSSFSIDEYRKLESSEEEEEESEEEEEEEYLD